MATTKTLTIVRGKTLQQVIRWETTPVVRKAITAISTTSGAPRLTVPLHGLTNGWRAACIGIKGTKELNAADPAKLRDSDYYEVTVIDANTIEFNDVNAADFAAYTSGGFIVFNSPCDLAGYTAEVVIKDKVGGTVLLSSRLSDAPLNLITATVDNAAKTVAIEISATDTTALAWKKGVWEVEMHSGSGVVSSMIAPSAVTVADEVAT
jgi:hypothetical protein